MVRFSQRMKGSVGIQPSGARDLSCPAPFPLPPSGAGLSHMENPESDPRLGGTGRSAAAATPWNRIANRPESKHELRLCPFGACSSGQLLARKFLPYAIPLPLKGGGVGRGAA